MAEKLAKLVNLRHNDKKKSVCLAAIEILPGDLGVDIPEVALNLPERSVIREIYTVTESDHDAGDVTIQSYDAAGAPVGIVDVPLSMPVVGTLPNMLGSYIYTGSGMELRIKTSAEQTTGIIQVCVLYDEPTLSTGMLTASTL